MLLCVNTSTLQPYRIFGSVRVRDRQRLYAAMRTASNTTYDHNRHWTTVVLVLLALTCIGAGPPSLRSGHSQPLRLTPAQVESLAAISQGPEVEAKAASLIDRASNTVVWSNQVRDVLPMASTTKLMTVLIALETLSADQVESGNSFGQQIRLA